MSSSVWGWGRGGMGGLCVPSLNHILGVYPTLCCVSYLRSLSDPHRVMVMIMVVVVVVMVMMVVVMAMMMAEGPVVVKIAIIILSRVRCTSIENATMTMMNCWVEIFQNDSFIHSCHDHLMMTMSGY